MTIKRARSRHGGLTTRELNNLIKKFENLPVDQILADCTREMGEVYLKKLKENTPIRDQKYDAPYSRWEADGGKGFMRESWELTSVIPRGKNKYEVTVKNDARFAHAVEYGHKQIDKKTGELRFVHQLTPWGKYLKQEKVEGIHVIKKTKAELAESKVMHNTLKRKVNKELKRMLNGK